MYRSLLHSISLNVGLVVVFHHYLRSCDVVSGEGLLTWLPECAGMELRAQAQVYAPARTTSSWESRCVGFRSLPDGLSFSMSDRCYKGQFLCAGPVICM